MTNNRPEKKLSHRGKTFIHPSWLAKALAGDRHCDYSLHLQANYKIPKTDRDFDLLAYKSKHQAAIERTVKPLISQGYQVHIENANSFWVNSGNAVISGTPDIIAIKGDDVIIIDNKTGKPRACDQEQVKLYMALIVSVKLHGITKIPLGKVIYDNYSPVVIFPEEITEEFRARARNLVKMLKSTTIPLPTPSYRECQWCPVAHVCSHKMEDMATGTAEWL